MTQLTVTEVRNALRCPRVFALGRRTGRNVAFPVGSSSLGGPFHRIVQRFAQGVAEPPQDFAELRPDASMERVAERLGAWLIRLLVEEIDRSPSMESMPAETDDLAEALRHFAFYWAQRITGKQPSAAAALAASLRASELELEAAIAEAKGTSILLRGSADGIYRGDDGQWEVVEYKLTSSANQELDRAQVALYRELLRRSRGVDATPTILRFSPELTVTRVPVAEADALVKSRILPLIHSMEAWSSDLQRVPRTEQPELCPSCPVHRACTEAFGDVKDPSNSPEVDAEGKVIPGAPSLFPPPAAELDREGEKEAMELQRIVLQLLKRLGVNATVRMAPQVGARMIRIGVMARGQVKRLDGKAEDVRHCLESEHHRHAAYEKDQGMRSFLVQRLQPRTVELDALLANHAEWLGARAGRFIVGEALDGQCVRGDLADPASCHLLVAGMTGSGKSVFLKTLLHSLTRFQPPRTILLTLVDPKRVTFGSAVARGLGNYLAQKVCYDPEQALSCAEDLVDEMERRYLLFEAAGVENLDEYNGDVAPEKRIPRHVYVVDEFADLMLDKGLRDPFETTVKRLSAKARAAGIHLVLATQRPDAKVIPGIIKANIPGKIALHVQSSVDSRIILDMSGAENLLGKGDLIAHLGAGPIRAQAPKVD